MSRNSRELILPLFLVLLMIGSPIAMVGVSADGPSDDETFEIADNVEVWDRSFLPLRANTDDATTVVDLPQDLRFEQGGEVIQSDVTSVGIYKQGEEVNFDFEVTSGANIGNLDLAEDSTQVHAVRFDQNSSASDFEQDDIPNSIDELKDLLNKEDINSNTAFYNITPDNLSLGNDGDFSFSHEFDDSGLYVVMVTKADGGNGIVLDSEPTGDFDRIDGDILIGGVEHVAVQSDVTADAGAPSSAEPGDDLEFSVDSELGGSDVNHVVMVYNEQTVLDDTLIIDVPENIDGDTNISDIEFNSNIGFVSGVANLDDDVRLLGSTLEARSANGQFGIEDTVSRLTSQINSSQPQINEGETILNASTTGVVGDSSTTLTVETLDSWEEGDYRFVYIASGDDSTEFSSQTGTIDIAEETTPPTTTPPRSGSSGSSGSDDTPPTTPPAPGLDRVVETTPVDENTVEVATQATAGERIGIRFSETEEDRTSGVSFSNLDVTATQDVDINIRSTRSQNAPEGTPAVGTSSDGFSYMQLDYDESLADSVDEIEFGFRVSKERLENQDKDAEDIRLYRLDGDEWDELETSTTGETDTHYNFSAESPGLSLYSVSATDEPAEDETDESVEDTQDPAEPDEGSSLIVILLVIALLVAVAGGGVYYYQQQQNQGPGNF